jgi:hypothetical protein
MDESFSNIFSLYIVLIGGKSSQPLFEHVYPQRIITCNHNVYS